MLIAVNLYFGRDNKTNDYNDDNNNMLLVATARSQELCTYELYYAY